INNSNEVAFLGSANSQTGIFVGPDPLNDNVLLIGDMLDGRIVQNLFTSSEMLNDLGQIVFLAQFTDGSSAIYLAMPVPEQSGDVCRSFCNHVIEREEESF